MVYVRCTQDACMPAGNLALHNERAVIYLYVERSENCIPCSGRLLLSISHWWLPGFRKQGKQHLLTLNFSIGEIPHQNQLNTIDFLTEKSETCLKNCQCLITSIEIFTHYKAKKLSSTPCTFSVGLHVCRC